MTTGDPAPQPKAFDAATLHGRAASFVERATGAAPLAITALEGGASTRRYLRVRLAPASGRGAADAIVMFVPDAAPEEATSAAAAPARWPFLEVRDLLEAAGARVPAILAEATGDGFLLLEDLGDTTLDVLLKIAPGRAVEAYDLAVTNLAAAQRRLATLPEGSVVATRGFDAALLRWELDHYREWGLEARGVALDAAELARFADVASRLAERVAALPRTFVHRDYQSRNLMVLSPGDVREGAPLELAWIDFQDALLGPRVYDLVALLFDSYQTFDDAFFEGRVATFARALGEDPAAIAREVWLVAVQRKLKDAGRFVFIDRVKGNPSFLPYFEPTRGLVKRAAAKLAGDADVDELVALAKLDR